jgi:hypothetical protein
MGNIRYLGPLIKAQALGEPPAAGMKMESPRPPETGPVLFKPVLFDKTEECSF